MPAMIFKENLVLLCQSTPGLGTTYKALAKDFATSESWVKKAFTRGVGRMQGRNKPIIERVATRLGVKPRELWEQGAATRTLLAREQASMTEMQFQWIAHELWDLVGYGDHKYLIALINDLHQAKFGNRHNTSYWTIYKYKKYER